MREMSTSIAQLKGGLCVFFLPALTCKVFELEQVCGLFDGGLNAARWRRRRQCAAPKLTCRTYNAAPNRGVGALVVSEAGAPKKKS
jgi:hypothetical protein